MHRNFSKFEIQSQLITKQRKKLNLKSVSSIADGTKKTPNRLHWIIPCHRIQQENTQNRIHQETLPVVTIAIICSTLTSR